MVDSAIYMKIFWKCLHGVELNAQTDTAAPAGLRHEY